MASPPSVSAIHLTSPISEPALAIRRWGIQIGTGPAMHAMSSSTPASPRWRRRALGCSVVWMRCGAPSPSIASAAPMLSLGAGVRLGFGPSFTSNAATMSRLTCASSHGVPSGPTRSAA